MASLNSNIQNKMNNNNNNRKSNSSSSGMSDFLKNKKLIYGVGGLIILITLAFLVIIIVQLLRTYHQKKIDKVKSVKLLNNIYDCHERKQPNIIPNSQFPELVIGNNYNLTFWLYINDINKETYHLDKFVLVRGDITLPENQKEQHYPMSNPSIYIKKNTNELHFNFGVVGESSYSGCYPLKQKYLLQFLEEKLTTNFPSYESIKQIQINDNIELKTQELTFNIADGEAFSFDIDFGVETIGRGLNDNIPLPTGTNKSLVLVNLFMLKDSSTNYIYFNIGKVSEKNKTVKYYLIVFTRTTAVGTKITNFTSNTSQILLKNSEKNNIQVKKNGNNIELRLNKVNPPNNNIASTDISSYKNIILGTNHFEYEPTTTISLIIDQTNITFPMSSGGNKVNTFYAMPNILHHNYSKEIKVSNFKYEPKETAVGTTRNNDYTREEYENTGPNVEYYSMTNPRYETDKFKAIVNQDVRINNQEITDYIGQRTRVNDTFCEFEDVTVQKRSPYDLGGKEYEYINEMGTADNETGECKIDNIPQQTWNCISLNIHNNIVDVFLNNKLIKTTKYPKAIKQISEDMILGPDKGFNGYLTSITFKNKNLNHKEIKKLYNKGPKISSNIKESFEKVFGKIIGK